MHEIPNRRVTFHAPPCASVACTCGGKMWIATRGRRGPMRGGGGMRAEGGQLFLPPEIAVLFV